MPGGENNRPTYQQLLAKWIDDSGLTLREIAERCASFGEPITYSYISKLRSGKLPPPSTDVNSALAKALGKSAGPLYDLALLEKFDPAWQELFWSLISLAVDPRKPVLEQFETYNIRDLSWVMNEVFHGQLPGDNTDQRRRHVTEKAFEVVAMRLRHLIGPRADLGCYDIYDEPPKWPVVRDLTLGDYLTAERELGRDANYALVVKDSAMSDMGFWPGDLLLVKQGSEGVASGDTVLVRLRDQLTARRYYAVGDSFRLEPALFAGAPISTDGVEILGIVRGLQRKI